MKRAPVEKLSWPENSWNLLMQKWRKMTSWHLLVRLDDFLKKLTSKNITIFHQLIFCLNFRPPETTLLRTLSSGVCLYHKKSMEEIRMDEMGTPLLPNGSRGKSSCPPTICAGMPWQRRNLWRHNLHRQKYHLAWKAREDLLQKRRGTSENETKKQASL